MSSSARRTSLTLVHSLTLVLLSCSLAFGQSFTASVRGTAKDSSGGVVPLASVTITDAERGTSQTTLADEAGPIHHHRSAARPIRADCRVQRLQEILERHVFTLTVQQQATVDAMLELGQMSETVEVSAAAAMVNTTIANLGQVIDNETIVSLPNIGRNPMSFTYLTPGRRRLWRTSG